MKKTILLACLATLLLSGCASTGGGKDPNPDPMPYPRPWPDCQFGPYDPFCRPPFPPMPVPPLPRPLPPKH